MPTRRRVVLWAAAAGATAAALGSAEAVRRWNRRRPLRRAALVAHLLREFGDLRPTATDVERFVDLYRKYHLANVRPGGLRHLEETFLMSTDFFQSGQQRVGPVRMVSLYHPYAFPCYNPFLETDDA